MDRNNPMDPHAIREHWRDPLGDDRRDVMIPIWRTHGRCKARSKQSKKRCRKVPLLGGTVCEKHGGAAAQVKAAAEARVLEALVLPAVYRLGELIQQRDSPAVAARAIDSLLDRTGFGRGVSSHAHVENPPPSEERFNALVRELKARMPRSAGDA